MFLNWFLLSPTEHILCAYLGDVLIKPKASALITGLNSPSCVSPVQAKTAVELQPQGHYKDHSVHQLLFFPGFSYIVSSIKGHSPILS